MIGAALEGLQRATPLRFEHAARYDSKHGLGFIVRRGEATIPVVVVWWSSRITSNTLSQIRERLIAEKGSADVAILATEHVGPSVASLLKDSGVQFLDTTGNAHLDIGPSYVWVAGRPAPERAAQAPGSLTASAWRLAFALLVDPRNGSQTTRALARLVGLSPATISRALAALSDRDWITRTSSGHDTRYHVHQKALWSAWELGYVTSLFGDLFITRASAPTFPDLHHWSVHARTQTGDDALLGGEAAARLLGAPIIESTAALHVRTWDATVMRRFRVLPDPDGPITVLQRFGPDRHVHHANYASDLLIRAELLRIPDDRLDEARLLLHHRIRARLES